MKKILVTLLGVLLMVTVMSTNALAADKEMRGAWVSTVYNMDWPSTKNNVEKQKEEFITMLDKLQEVGMNTVIVQVRPKGDALYKSNINPWSDVLTGTQGKYPGYDPLSFMVEETHRRGMEFHAWFNPYRITTGTAASPNTDISKLASNHPAKLHPEWVISDGNALYYNPGLPEVRQHIVDTIKEVVSNYNVDAIHFDDYFYKVAMSKDDTYENSGSTLSEEDWRRENVNTLVKDVYNAIKKINSSVEFGISPRGIWKNSASGTSGGESFTQDFADSVKWIQNGWIDYITPQLYWRFDNKAAPYGKLVDWWSEQVKGTNVKLYVGQGVYKDGSSSYPENVVEEIEKQISYNRENPEVDGSMYFSTRNIIKNTTLQAALKRVNAFAQIQLKGKSRYETSVEVSKEGWGNGSSTVLLVNGFASADGITASPLAAAYDAPILLTEQNIIPVSTKAEIKRLNPSKVILIGGEGVLSDKIIEELKSINSTLTIDRIGGINRYETSLLIAQRLDSIVDVNKTYVCYGLGEPDALSVAAKAAMDKAPIVLTGNSEVPAATFQWLKEENIDTAYFIGGAGIIYDSVINQVNQITTENVSGNRVFGKNRYETNAEVIRKFYPEATQSAMLVSKGFVLADALTAGPLAAKVGGPIVLVDSALTNSQKDILSTKQSPKLYEIGGGIDPNAIKDIISRIK